MATFSRIAPKPLVAAESATDALRRSRTALAVRLVYGAYLTLVVIAHLAVLPALYRIALEPCQPGSCFGRQIDAESFARLEGYGISPESYAVVMTILVLLIPIFAHLLATIVVIQRPTDWLALFFVLTFAFCSTGASEARFAIAAEFPSVGSWLHYIDIPVFFGFTALAVLFPDGRFVPRWSWILLFFPLFDVVMAYRPAWYDTAPEIFSVAGRTWWELSAYLLPICLLYRRHVTTDPLRSRQVRTLLVGMIPLISALLLISVLGRTNPGLESSGSLFAASLTILWAIGVVSMLFALFISVNLDDLFDLRIAFDRTLIYVVLSILLFFAYLVTVIAVSVLLPNSARAVPVSIATAVVALAFAPLRSILQRWSRHLLFGEGEEPYRLLQRLGNQIDVADTPEAVTQSILASVQTGLRVPGASLAIADAPMLSGSIGKPVGANPEVAAVRYGDRHLGTLSVARRSPSERFGDQDRLLIWEIARQTGITVHSVMQSEALQQSREHIVNAREEERRRLRRDLHDGIGPSLAALTMQIEHARDLMDHDAARAGVLLDEAVDQIRESIGTIRTIVYDLRPPALDELGLPSAIRAYASRFDGARLHVVCDLPKSLPQLPAAVEVATYRIVQEGLTNVVRHAGARHAWVSLVVDRSTLSVSIRDDGAGIGDTRGAGVGLVSMQERTSELGGTFVLTNSTSGVTLDASFPLHPRGTSQT